MVSRSVGMGLTEMICHG
ncbi:hypothetical protein F383_06548 [Gossypium arboreum]|uniref:Uncharacterized protein n=1 Tax=Gossypium arboreum TaxID=29729 RepID=A0A0B0P871_GOSAR|nr:hypothetical protein F383_06548 [Gossypium arboreum]